MSASSMSGLVSSIREVQKLQADARAKLGQLEAAEHKAAPVSGLPTGKCVHWLQTTECKASGPVWVNNGVQTTKSCSEQLQSTWSGYCVCGTGSNQTKIGFDCNGGQGGRTCQDICKETGASAYGPLPATDAAACLQGGGVFTGQGGLGFAVANPGSYFPGCPADARCCVPLTGTINVSDADEIIVSGASGSLVYVNGTYTRMSDWTQNGAPAFQSANQQLVLDSNGWTFGDNLLTASGPFAKDNKRIPVGGPAEPWQASTGESADASNIRLSAVSKADATQDAAQKAALSNRLQELQGIETTLLSELRTQRLATADESTATSLALKAESKAASLVEAESEEQRRRLTSEHGQAAKDTTLIVAARSAAMRATAYTKVTLVGIVVLIVAFIIYRLNRAKTIDRDMSFILVVAAGGAALIIITVMLNNIRSRNPRNFAKLYFTPPSGPSSGPSSDANAFSSSNSDGNDINSCRRALRAANSI